MESKKFRVNFLCCSGREGVKDLKGVLLICCCDPGMSENLAIDNDVIY